MVDSVLFDLDGTLWDAIPGITRTWNKALSDLGIQKTCTEQEVRSYMGMTLDKICSSMIGEEDPEKIQRLFDAISDWETRCITLDGASLYPDERETLALLARRCRLFIVSNCGRGYIERFLDLFDLGRFFTDHECFGGT
ncbi:MAG: HAD family hydrolase [Clostridia bacterium]|nr:HAD family hydrolase [Clostridia bacterium]